MPDYEFVLWDKDRIQHLLKIPFVEQAMAAKEWAFASDYIRWYALYTEGGIYLDSDVKVRKRFDHFLKHRAFMASYTPAKRWKMPNRPAGDYYVEAEMIGTEKGHPLMKQCLDSYENQNFSKSDGWTVDVGIAPVVLTNACIRFGYQTTKYTEDIYFIDEGIAIFPEVYLGNVQGKFSFKHTHAVHFCMSSWIGDRFLKKDALFHLRKLHRSLITNYFFFGRLHYVGKNCLGSIKKLIHIE